MLLALFIVAKFVQKFIPDLPNGLGDVTVLMEVLIILSSLVVGWWRTAIAVLIYIGLFAWLDISTFMGGLLWVDKTSDKFWIYLLDYLIPLLAISLAGLFKNKNIFWNIANVIIVITINYGAHVISGVVFWGSYAWSGWGATAYSFAANAIRNGVMLALGLVVTPIAFYAIKPHLNFIDAEA